MSAATPLVHVLIALGVIVALARGVGRLLHRLGQPAVIGEILAGILLGPSLLGALAPALHHALLPADVAPYLRVIRARLADAVVVLLLPSFFAFTGMRTEIGLLDGGWAWLACCAVIAVAAGGKLGGAALAARATGSDWRQSLTLGVLLNTRGLMELIVLNIGLDLGVLSPTLFSMFVVMALVTTAATAPLLGLLAKRALSRG